MDFQALTEIADREFTSGLADPRDYHRALAEANGVEAHARQIFWRLRAKQLQSLAAERGEEALHEVLLAVEAQERRTRRRKESTRWFWALACIAGLLGTAIFPWFMIQAVGTEGRRFYVFSVLTLASLGLATYAYLASRYHTHAD